MDEQTLQLCEEILGYRFSDTDLLALAMTHASIASTRTESNERLEFLGDAVLGLVVCEELYCFEDELLEGEMTRIKSAVVSRSTCAEIADEMGICDHVLLGKGMAEPVLPRSVAAALVESVIGAIYVDGGLEEARKFILDHFRPSVEKVLRNEHARNFKSKLQQFAQRRWGMTPEYQLLDEKGPDHSKCFEVAVSVDGRQFPSAWGKNKKEAEQKAAGKALEALGIETDQTAGPAE